MAYEIVQMTSADYEDAVSLWNRCEGIGLSDADEREPLSKFLDRNQGLCFIAKENGDVVGTVLCGTDWRRGYLYHLAVDPFHRRQGIGRALVECVFNGLKNLDIHKCHIMVYGENETGLKFWKQSGWSLRPEVILMSYNVKPACGDSPC